MVRLGVTMQGGLLLQDMAASVGVDPGLSDTEIQKREPAHKACRPSIVPINRFVPVCPLPGETVRAAPVVSNRGSGPGPIDPPTLLPTPASTLDNPASASQNPVRK